jgi:hypothetical protein
MLRLIWRPFTAPKVGGPVRPHRSHSGKDQPCQSKARGPVPTIKEDTYARSTCCHAAPSHLLAAPTTGMSAAQLYVAAAMR